METYEVGTVAVATVLGVEGVHVTRSCDLPSPAKWISATSVGANGHFHRDVHVTDIRPLVVLDFEGARVDVGGIVDALRERHKSMMRGIDAQTGWSIIADQIEAQTKPPRIPEPGWGEKVRARTLGNGHEREFLRYKADDPDFRWADGHEQYRWSDLIDPEPVTS